MSYLFSMLSPFSVVVTRLEQLIGWNFASMHSVRTRDVEYGGLKPLLSGKITSVRSTALDRILVL
jgi:hypothetical protein